MDQVGQTSDGYYHSLRRNVVLTIIMVSVTPMFLVSTLILYQFNVSYQEKVETHLKTLVKKHKQNINSFLREKSSDIRSLAKTFSFEKLSDETFLRDSLEVLWQWCS